MAKASHQKMQPWTQGFPLHHTALPLHSKAPHFWPSSPAAGKVIISVPQYRLHINPSNKSPIPSPLSHLSHHHPCHILHTITFVTSFTPSPLSHPSHHHPCHTLHTITLVTSFTPSPLSHPSHHHLTFSLA